VSTGEFINSSTATTALARKFSAQVCYTSRGLSVASATEPSAEENHASNHRTRLFDEAPVNSIVTSSPGFVDERWVGTHQLPLYRRPAGSESGPWQPWINEEDWEYERSCGCHWERLVWGKWLCSIRANHLAGAFERWRLAQIRVKLADRGMAAVRIFECAGKAGVQRVHQR